MSEWKSHAHVLAHPVEGEGPEPVVRIVLREPDVEALERIEDLGLTPEANPTVAQLRAIIAILARVPDDTIRRLHRDDFRALAELCAPLLVGPDA